MPRHGRYNRILKGVSSFFQVACRLICLLVSFCRSRLYLYASSRSSMFGDGSRNGAYVRAIIARFPICRATRDICLRLMSSLRATTTVVMDLAKDLTYRACNHVEASARQNVVVLTRVRTNHCRRKSLRVRFVRFNLTSITCLIFATSKRRFRYKLRRPNLIRSVFYASADFMDCLNIAAKIFSVGVKNASSDFYVGKRQTLYRANRCNRYRASNGSCLLLRRWVFPFSIVDGAIDSPLNDGKSRYQ